MTLLAISLSAVILAVFLWWQNNGISVSNVIYTCSDLPDTFDGFRILHVSDLHNKAFGKGQKRIIGVMAHTKPDMIAVTGDIIDKRRFGTAAALTLALEAVKVAPVYYVPGNHEKTAGIYEQLSERLKSLGVKVIANDAERIERNGAEIILAGVKDWEFYRPGITKEERKSGRTRADAEFELRLSVLSHQHPSGFRVLLSHRPEKMDVYAKYGYHLVLTGHAHGGQWRFPFVGGLYAPNQGIIPEYSSGIHYKGQTGMVVSRGLGNSGFPLRLFNRPELVVVTLKRR